ncbi:hypothetical protein DFH08DRAFT_805839 [Mycena albidolilacea]|uniref:Uncharacterized protein n=1 Tax=Mycena albidolilacea TaxID=1033008 RepID=A0AAD7EX95_9AGAR|nr:hypothetical protein DFH08DRAFT_805839 [Mycena albidolilacea]
MAVLTTLLSIRWTLQRLEECDEATERDVYRENSQLCERRRKPGERPSRRKGEPPPRQQVGGRQHPTPSEMEGVELQNPFSSALSTAASSGVLHLVGQQGAPSTSTQTQDFDEEMDDPLRSWTPDEDDEWGMGPPI